MNTTTTRRLWTIIALLGVAGATTACLSGCARNRASGRTGLFNRSAAKPSGHIVLDGKFDDWPEGAAVIADADWIYMHATVEGGTAPIQAAPETLALWLDADGDAKTGMAPPAPAAARAMGVDLIVEFSPADAEHPGKTKPGVQVQAFETGGTKVQLNAEQIGLASLPTVASTSYEIRIARHANAAMAPTLVRALAAKGNGRAMFVLKDASGKMLGWSDPETFSKPAMSKNAPAIDQAIPAKPAGSVRVVSYNVLKSKLAKEPQTFSRLFQVLNPDVIMCQEWDADAATATAWFTAVVTGTHSWNARSGGGDVVIVSPYPIAPLGPDTLTIPTGSGGEEKESVVRFVGGTVRAPAGPLAVGCMHLKCCGTAGSAEDKTRMAQAAKINETWRSALARDGSKVRVLGGDLNLVGSRAPLETLLAGLDSDGSALAVANPQILGDAAELTWRDGKTEFPPGRLDYIAYSGATAEVAQAFVVDTGRFSAKALASMGLDSDDTGASDHLPVVVDLVPR